MPVTPPFLLKLAKVPKPQTPNLKQALISTYLALADQYSFQKDTGKGVDLFLMSGRETVALEIQFGSKAEIRKSIRRLVRCQPHYACLVFSSANRLFSLRTLRNFIIGECKLKEFPLLLIDIETQSALKVNFPGEGPSTGALV